MTGKKYFWARGHQMTRGSKLACPELFQWNRIGPRTLLTESTHYSLTTNSANHRSVLLPVRRQVMGQGLLQRLLSYQTTPFNIKAVKCPELLDNNPDQRKEDRHFFFSSGRKAAMANLE